jgi:hypothetical protein
MVRSRIFSFFDLLKVLFKQQIAIGTLESKPIDRSISSWEKIPDSRPLDLWEPILGSHVAVSIKVIVHINIAFRPASINRTKSYVQRRASVWSSLKARTGAQFDSLWIRYAPFPFSDALGFASNHEHRKHSVPIRNCTKCSRLASGSYGTGASEAPFGQSGLMEYPFWSGREFDPVNSRSPFLRPWRLPAEFRSFPEEISFPLMPLCLSVWWPSSEIVFPNWEGERFIPVLEEPGQISLIVKTDENPKHLTSSSERFNALICFLPSQFATRS